MMIAASAGETVSQVGGGICQVSSTLYYCALLGDLEIVTRQNHSYVSSYIDPGLDATVSWGGPDFRFRNNTAYPIRIEAEVSGGYVSIRLMGTDEKDYYIKLEYTIVATEEYATVYEEYPADNAKGYTDGQVLQYGVNGMTVKSYKCRYDKETNELISRDYEATSRYKKKDHILVTIKPEETQPPETSEPTEESTAPSDTPAEENTP